VHEANYECYGYRRTWKQLLREGERVPRCRVQRLMRDHGIRGANRRGKPWRTTNADPEAERRPDLGAGVAERERHSQSVEHPSRSPIAWQPTACKHLAA
jgi:transposase InsO family protein